MKKLLAGLLIGGLFSLGCGTETTTPKGSPPPKSVTAPTKPVKPGDGKDESKPEPKKDENGKPEPKKDDSKKNQPKKDSN